MSSGYLNSIQKYAGGSPVLTRIQTYTRICFYVFLFVCYVWTELGDLDEIACKFSSSVQIYE